MELKLTIQGLLVYIAMGGYLLAFVVSVMRLRKTGQVLYLFGFIAALAAFGYRWYHVRHVPMQNLFEIFLILGMIYPVTLFSRYVLRTGGDIADMLLGAIVLFPAGFIFHAQPQHLPPALQNWIFIPHVAVYIIAYIFMAKAAYQAALQLSGKNSAGEINLLPPEQATYRLIQFGFPLLTLGLILGSYWGKLAWGDWWGWDPKELWSLASWLVYAGYLHYRYMFGGKHPRINSLWAVAGIIVILITLLWVNLSRLFPGLHNYAS